MPRQETKTLGGKPYYACCHVRRLTIDNILFEIQCNACKRNSHFFTASSAMNMKMLVEVIEAQPQMFKELGVIECSYCQEAKDIVYIYHIDLKS